LEVLREIKTPELWKSGWRQTRKGEGLLVARWLAIAGVAGSEGSWSCSWITDIAEVDERHVVPKLR
jgi:hypothetical protein